MRACGSCVNVNTFISCLELPIQIFIRPLKLNVEFPITFLSANNEATSLLFIIHYLPVVCTVSLSFSNLLNSMSQGYLCKMDTCYYLMLDIDCGKTLTLPKQLQKCVLCCFFQIMNYFKIFTYQMRA